MGPGVERVNPTVKASVSGGLGDDIGRAVFAHEQVRDAPRGKHGKRELGAELSVHRRPAGKE